MWTYVYLGPPDFLSVDQGTAYVSQEMKGYLDAEGITMKEAPIETPGAIGIVERYHAPLRAAFDKIRADSPRNTTDAECLRMAVYAVNNTTGPEGLCPTLLVFGALPRPARRIPSVSQLARAEMIDKAMDTVSKEQSKRRIQFGLRHQKGPKGKEDKHNLSNLPAGSKVLVYRTTSKTWEGPHLFVSEQNDTAVVQTAAG